MPNFESPIGGRNFSSSSMREFDVTDETGYHKSPKPMINEQDLRNFQSRVENHNADEERELMAARDARRTGKEKISEGAKRRIEILLGMIQTTKEVKIQDNIFVLRTLKSKEMREALVATSEYDGTVQTPYEMRRQILSRSLTHISGVEIEQFIGSNTLDSKMLFLDELDEALLSRLYQEYVDLNKISRDKYAINNENDVKEVVEDIKK